MAKKRMFSTDMVDTDAFLNMPGGAKLLYFYLGTHGDDDGRRRRAAPGRSRSH